MGTQKLGMRRRDQQSKNADRFCLSAPPGVIRREVRESLCGRRDGRQCGQRAWSTSRAQLSDALVERMFKHVLTDVGRAHSDRVISGPAFWRVHKQLKSLLGLPLTEEPKPQTLMQDQPVLRRPRNFIRWSWVTVEEAFYRRRTDKKEQRNKQAGKKWTPEGWVCGYM